MHKLKRTLGLFEAIMYGVGVIVGVGVYSLIGKASAFAGNATWLAFLLGAFIAVCTGMSYAELSSMFPKSSADYYYITKAFNNRFLAFLVSWLLIFAGLVGIATVSRGFSGYAKGLSSVNETVLSILLIIFISFVVIRGIKISSALNVLLVALTIFGLLIVIGFGIRHFGSVDYFYSPYGLNGILVAAPIIFFAFLGFENIVSIAEETKSPRKNIPRAIIGSIAITTILYILVSLSIVSLVGWQVLANSDAPLALAVEKESNIGSFIITLIALTATSSTVLGLIIYLSRIVYGIAKEGSLPKFLALVHPRYKTPWVAIAVIAFFSILFLFFGDMVTTASLATFSTLTAFIAVNLAVIWLRRYKISRKFKVPLNVRNFPIPSFLGIVLCSFMLLNVSLEVFKVGLLIILAGIIYSLILDRILRWLRVWENLKRALSKISRSF
jgi:APA family basic amino acid/polyamine antiporter